MEVKTPEEIEKKEELLKIIKENIKLHEELYVTMKEKFK